MKISEFCWEDIAPVFAILATENNGAWTYEQLEHSLKLENVICYVAKNDDKVLGFVLLEETPYDFDIFGASLYPFFLAYYSALIL